MNKIILVIYTKRKQKNEKSGKEYPTKVFYFEYSDANGGTKRIAIKPLDKYDYAKLEAVAKVEYNDSVKEK